VSDSTIKAENGTLQVVTQHRSGGVEIQEQSEEKQITAFAVSNEPLATISATGSQTFNLGNYESKRIAVSVTLPCKTTDVHRAFDSAFEIINQQMTLRAHP
jgi:hypothetical protein